ncbi:type III PLP-dependent enzyme domain-containing protein [Nakamurella lactea]|uniref:hypothetical protein n=1 Tax=Nakamurella lactea TaxID=459515 RepID=UPI0003FAAD9C|nr:hypothetical protein [Nakamurella lactea]
MDATNHWLIPDDQRIDWRSKAFGPGQLGRTIGDLVADQTVVSDLPTPLVTLDAAALEYNIEVMAEFLNAGDLLLAPHGKTTMAPQLWHRQLRAGAWGITVATPWQMRVAVQHAVPTIMHAGAMLAPGDLAFVARHLDADPRARVLVWADSPAVVAVIAHGFPTSGRKLEVLVERGGPGARTGARTLEESLHTAEAVAAAPNLTLAGVSAWEGSLVGTSGPNGRDVVARFCDGVADTLESAVQNGLLSPDDRPVLTGGGSAYFDIVAERWGRLRGLGAQIVLRSGCYLTHDDGGYAKSSPFGRTVGRPLRAALHAWGQVVSRPESGLALLNFGKRDVTFDSAFPVPQAIRGRDETGIDAALAGAHISEANDQHSYLRLDPDSDLKVGEVVRCGIAHPCLTFDKWTVIPVLDRTDVAEPRMIGAVRTIF